MLGKQHTWPADGEIDIIEGVNDQVYSESTLHTKRGCSVKGVPGSKFSGKRMLKYGQVATDCAAYGRSQGCGIRSADDSLGKRLEAKGGGTWMMVWTKSQPGVHVGSISLWFRPRGRRGKPVEPDAVSGVPKSFGKPYAY